MVLLVIFAQKVQHYPPLPPAFPFSRRSVHRNVQHLCPDHYQYYCITTATTTIIITIISILICISQLFSLLLLSFFLLLQASGIFSLDHILNPVPVIAGVSGFAFFKRILWGKRSCSHLTLFWSQSEGRTFLELLSRTPNRMAGHIFDPLN